MIEINPKFENKPKTRKQTQSSETKNRGAGVQHRGVCVGCSKQTQNSQKNPKLRKKIVRWALSIVVCASNVRNKPKIRKQTQNSEAKNRGVYISLQIIRSRRDKKSFQYLF